MNEYWGFNNSKIKKPENRKDIMPFVCKNFSRIYIELDTFCDRMFWSLSDHKSMAAMGYRDPIK